MHVANLEETATLQIPTKVYIAACYALHVAYCMALAILTRAHM